MSTASPHSLPFQKLLSIHPRTEKQKYYGANKSSHDYEIFIKFFKPHLDELNFLRVKSAAKSCIATIALAGLNRNTFRGKVLLLSKNRESFERSQLGAWHC